MSADPMAAVRQALERKRLAEQVLRDERARNVERYKSDPQAAARIAADELAARNRSLQSSHYEVDPLEAFIPRR